jgi:hypothetical protein
MSDAERSEQEAWLAGADSTYATRLRAVVCLHKTSTNAVYLGGQAAQKTYT